MARALRLRNEAATSPLPRRSRPVRIALHVRTREANAVAVQGRRGFGVIRARISSWRTRSTTWRARAPERSSQPVSPWECALMNSEFLSRQRSGDVRQGQPVAASLESRDYWAAATFAECALQESLMGMGTASVAEANRAAGALRPPSGDCDSTLFQLEFLRLRARRRSSVLLKSCGRRPSPVTLPLRRRWKMSLPQPLRVRRRRWPQTLRPLRSRETNRCRTPASEQRLATVARLRQTSRSKRPCRRTQASLRQASACRRLGGSLLTTRS